MSDNELASLMAAKWWEQRLNCGQDVNRRMFILSLANSIEKKLNENNGKPAIVGVDYDPDDTLLEALHAVGIECRGVAFSADGIFPYKHALVVYPDHLEPKEGYGNWTKIIPVPR